MKKLKALKISLVFALLTCIFCLPLPVKAAQTSKDTTEINIVFDDSGSMSEESYGITSWSQAKYAMEVFAAFMGNEDTVNVYPMSQSDTSNVFFTLKGSDQPEARVKKINDMNGYGATPIQPVVDAGQALQKSKADHKFLVVLTDGSFYDGFQDIPQEEAEKTIKGFADKDGITVIYVGIGPASQNIPVNGQAGIESYKIDADSILATITDIAQKVFSLQKIDVSAGDPCSFSVDIPISKLIIFAQGKNPEISDVQENGNPIKERAQSVNVKVDDSTPKPEGSPNAKVAPDLAGKVVTYKAPDANKPFASGNYTFKSSVKNVEVYIEPGIAFRTRLIGKSETGNTIDLSGTDAISSGEYKVDIEIYNPLDNQLIDPSKSALLKDSTFSLVVVDKDGNKQEFSNGEDAVLPPGDSTFHAEARLPGNISMVEDGKTITVEAGDLTVLFSQPGGYSLDTANLECEVPIQVSVLSPDGKVYDASNANELSFTMNGTEGISWKAEPAGNGVFTLLPSFSAPEKSAAISSDEMTLEVEVTANRGSYTQSGKTSADLKLFTIAPLPLHIELTNPPETFGDGSQKYMFDPNQRGTGSSAYILAKVQVEEEGGGLRDMTEEEWEAGLKGFNISAIPQYPSFIWRIVKWFCGQSLSFDIVKGEGTSTYRFYLSGLSAVNVLPNTSNLDVKLSFTLPNGMKEEGQAEDLVSVLPLSIWAYILLLVIILVIVVLLLMLLIMEILKPRFPRNLRMYLEGQCRDAPQGKVLAIPDQKTHPGPLIIEPSSRKHRFWPPLKPETLSFNIKATQTLGLLGITLTYAASRKGVTLMNPRCLERAANFTYGKHDEWEFKKLKQGATWNLQYSTHCYCRNLADGNFIDGTITFFLKAGKKKKH